MGEFEFIRWLRRQTPGDPRVRVGPGDDTAVLERPAAPLLVTADLLMEGSCFLLDEAGPRRVGRKAMNVNLSDIAAMAGRPTAAVVSLGLPRSLGRAGVQELFLGLREAADAFGVPVVGGDTNSWAGGLVVNVTMLGVATERGPVLRGGARLGDRILVTGSFGGSILGKHLDFTPRVREALRLHELADLHAMTDVSDGLSADLWHICEESGVGAVLRADGVPLAPAASRVGDGRPPLEHALSDGEDFELVFTLSPADAGRLVAAQPLGDVPVTEIGYVVESGLWLEDAAGGREALAPRGYAHEVHG